MTPSHIGRLWAMVLPLALSAAGCNWGGPKIDTAKAYIDAKTALLQAAEDPNDAGTRMEAMEAIGQVLPEEGGILKQGLDDSDERVRFAAAMALGDVKYAPALPALQEKAKPYTGERDKRVYCAILYALYRMGDVNHLGDLATLLFDRDPEVRAFAAQAMGKLGNPAAMGLLSQAVADEHNEKAKFNIIEAMTLLGDAGSRKLLESYASGYFLDLSLAAIPTVANEYTPDTMAILQNLMGSKHARVRVRAAGAMGKLGRVTPETYSLCVAAAKTPEKFVEQDESIDQIAAGLEVASLRQLAVISLGWMRRPDAEAVLYPLLQSPSGGVRGGAAMSILRLQSAGNPAAVEAAPAPASQPAKAPVAPAMRTSGAKD
jgi:HEAT repeat protein